MRVAVTGASGLIGGALVERLRACGEEVTILTRSPGQARKVHAQAAAAPRASGARRAQASEPSAVQSELELARWSPLEEPAPAAALAGRHAVIHLAGAPVAQRWSERAKRAIRDSRELGTRNLVAGLANLDPDDRPRVLVSASAIGYYGAHGPEPIDEEAPAGEDFLAQVCMAWESEARAAEALGLRCVQLRIGVVLDRSGGALAKMLPPFRLGLGGRVGSGEQYMAWIHREDLLAIALAALADERWSGPVNATAPEPVTGAAFAHVLGRTLHRPSLLPVPSVALSLLYGEMASIITTGVRAMPAKALVLGYSFAHPSLEEALRSALA
jgi:uncharacterized protein